MIALLESVKENALGKTFSHLVTISRTHINSCSAKNTFQFANNYMDVQNNCYYGKNTYAYVKNYSHINNISPDMLLGFLFLDKNISCGTH